MGASANTSERAEDRSEEDSHGFVTAMRWEPPEALAIPRLSLTAEIREKASKARGIDMSCHSSHANLQ
jgi:hypothetical protein